MPEPMGLELAEFRLLEALRSAPTDLALDVRVVGGRGARRHARRVAGRWIPSLPGRSSLLAGIGADLVHLIGLDLPPPKRRSFVATVHDLSPLHYPDEGELPPWLPEIVERASLLLTPSAFTASELRRHLDVPEERIRVIGSGPGLDAQSAEQLTPDELRHLGIEPPFVLRYGGYTMRKNVPLLLEAWARVPLGTLVLTGPRQPARDRILAEAPSLDRVVVLDYVPQTLLARLLRTASALVSTSTYEGFGLPSLEAMASGTPVVAAVAPFVEEVCGDAALLVAARPEVIGDAVHQVLVDSELAARLRATGPPRARQFDWAQTAATVLDAYSTAMTSP